MAEPKPPMDPPPPPGVVDLGPDAEYNHVAVPLHVDQMTLTKNVQCSAKPVNPWLLFFTALVAVGLGKLFDMVVTFALWWYYVHPLIEAAN